MLKHFVPLLNMVAFLKSSHALGYAQSTVTAHIKALENDLNIPLFDRLGKKYFLQKQVINFIRMH